MGRAFALKNDEEMQDMASSLGFNPDDLEEAAERDEPFEDHPVQIKDEGDILKALAIVGHIRDEIEEEEEAMERELETVREFRENRIEKKQDSIDFLTAPLRKYIDDWGKNYNGVGGHAGFHTVTTTDWKATSEELVAFAEKKGLRQKVTIKAELPSEAIAQIYQIVNKYDPEGHISQKAYKSAIKNYMKEEGLDGAPYGEKVGMNPLYAKKKREDFRVKPSDE